MNNIRERIRFILESHSCSVNAFARVSGITQVKLNNQINHDTMLSGDVFDAVLKIFPDVSAEWLMRGEGEMLKQNGGGVSIDTMTGGQVQVGGQGNHQTLTHASDALLKEKDARIAELEKDKDFLTTLLKNITGK